MWWRSKTVKKADVTAESLYEELAACRREVRALQLEWERTYDKLRGIVARMSRKNGSIEEETAAAPAAPVTTLPDRKLIRNLRGF